MTQLSLDRIAAELPALIAGLAPGDEIVLVDREKPAARVTPVASAAERPPRRLGTAKGVLTIVSEDDDHLQDFAEYM